LGFLADKVVKEKLVLSVEESLDAQYFMFSCSHEPVRAMLEKGILSIEIQGKGKLSPELDIKFLSYKDEVLLYLMLTGSKNFRPFTFDTASAKPAVSILKNDLTKPFVNSPGDTHNSSSEKSNGDFMESLMGVVLCACSHYGGVKGIDIDSYLRHILEEVHDSYPKISIESLVRIDEYDSSLDLMTPSSYFKPEHSLSLTVPYFSPPNSDWPKV
jgi:hypothetical protein